MPTRTQEWRKAGHRSETKTENNNESFFEYCIQPYYRPYPHNRLPPPDFFTLFSLIAHLTIFFLTIYFIFTNYRPLDDLLALVVENKFT